MAKVKGKVTIAVDADKDLAMQKQKRYWVISVQVLLLKKSMFREKLLILLENNRAGYKK